MFDYKSYFLVLSFINKNKLKFSFIFIKKILKRKALKLALKNQKIS